MSKNTALTSLTCLNNTAEPGPLDFRLNTALTDLSCAGGSISKGAPPQALTCHANNLTALDISAATNLLTLRAGTQQSGNLSLTLTPVQQTKWNNTWQAYAENTNITLEVK